MAKGIVLMIFCLWVLRAPAGTVVFDPDLNRITVSGYPEETPATLDDVLAADRAGGWKRVVYAPETDTYTVKASLWIGTNTDLGTFFQVGRLGNPRETLVLHGDLTVSPPRDMSRRVEHWRDHAGERRDGRYRVSNRLTLGDPDHPDIRPVVKIACSHREEFAVRILSDPVPSERQERWYVPMGELYMFNAVLTAATPDPDHAYAAAIALSHSGVNYVLRDSEISWWSGDLFRRAVFSTRHMTSEDRTMRGMTFANGGNADGLFRAVDCIFRNLDVALRNRDATRCVFENNRVNFDMTSSHYGIILTDCEIGPPSAPMLLPRSTRDERWLLNYSVYRPTDDFRLIMNPGVVERVSLPVKVMGEHGRPIAGAAVMLDCPGDTERWAVVLPLALTDRDGLTPPEGDDRALMITKSELRPTEDPEEPERVSHAYTMTVAAPGYRTHQSRFNSADDIPRPMIVTLRPE